MTDYDAPRRVAAAEPEDETLSDLATARARRRSDTTTAGDNDIVDTTYLTGLDTLGDDDALLAVVVPKQSDEFTCSRCFLVQHLSRLSKLTRRRLTCTDCA